jgi:cytochrome c553
MAKTKISTELKAALRACVTCHGRQWRSELHTAWMTGRYHHALKSHLAVLQSKRNTEGSTAWLRSLKTSSFMKQHR